MWDFLDVAEDLLRAGRVGLDKQPQFELVFKTIGSLQAVHSKSQLDLNNIESIFTVLELGKVIQRVPGVEASEIGNVIAALKSLIVTTLETTMKFPATRAQIGIPEPYSEFANLISFLVRDASPAQTVSVITFNYDIGCDIGMHRFGLGPVYVIDGDPGRSSDVPLLKLHGSLNWAVESESHRIRPLHMNMYLSKYNLSPFSEAEDVTVPIGSQMVDYFRKHQNLEVESEPVIVPPSWNKADYHNALSAVWASAANHLAEADSIFVIGYSLPETDSFFRHLYALGSVGAAPLRRFFVFNPDPPGSGVDARFRSLLGSGAASRYVYVQKTFQAAIQHVETLFPGRK